MEWDEGIKEAHLWGVGDDDVPDMIHQHDPGGAIGDS
jgi:hypothetical protein